MSPGLFLSERRRAILAKLQNHGRVSVKELSDELQVSTVTIRQDLRALEKEGLVERTYGGAILTDTAPGMSELSFTTRQKERRQEKESIAAAAARLVQNGYGIALDGSSTTFAMTRYLRTFDSLTIVTNSLMIAQQFLDTPHIEVLMPSGKLRRDSVSLVGRPDTVPSVNLNIGFFGVRGLSFEEGATDVSREEVQMKRELIQNCRQTVILADSSKWGQVAPYSFALIDGIDQVLTTTSTPRKNAQQFIDAGVMVTRARVSQGD